MAEGWNRLVSKVEAPKVAVPADFQMNIPLEDLKKAFNDDDLTNATFSLDGYVLINGIDATDAFYTWNSAGVEANTWDTWSRTGKSYLPSTFEADKSYASVYAGTTTGDMFLNSSTSVMYAYENLPIDDQTEPSLYFDRNTVYSFIIKGTLTSVTSGTPTTLTRYWRANLIPDDNQQVIRNAVYRLTIDGVNTFGYDTPKEAEDEVVPKKGNASVLITIRVADWRIKLTNVIL